MRRGEDRHELGPALQELIFPEGAGHVRGIKVGDDLASVVAREAREPELGQGRATYVFEVDDPNGVGRRLVVELLLQQQRVNNVTARFYSEDKIDVDAGHREVKRHLENLYGKPGREMTGVLKLVWEVGGGELPTRTSICHYRDGDGRALFEVRTALPEGAKLPAVGGPGKRPAA
jgi:hypothetical protein